MQKIGLLFVGLCLGTFQGCKSVVPYPENWSPPQRMPDSGLVVPTGLFANHGTSNDAKLNAPTLSAVLFENRLEGFDIDNIRIGLSGNGEELLIKPLVGSIELEAGLVLISGRKKGHPDRWILKSSKEYAGADIVAASVLYTGGLFMPLAAWRNYSFQLAEDGSLLIHLKKRELVDFFYFFPFTLTDEVWLRYPSFDPKPPTLESIPFEARPLQ